MADYKTDADRFYDQLEQHQRDFTAAETAQQLVDLLEQRGIDVDRFSADLAALGKSFKALGIDRVTQAELAKEILRRQLSKPVIRAN